MKGGVVREQGPSLTFCRKGTSPVLLGERREKKKKNKE